MWWLQDLPGRMQWPDREGQSGYEGIRKKPTRMCRLREHSQRDRLAQQADVHELDDASGVEQFMLKRKLLSVVVQGADDVVRE